MAKSYQAGTQLLIEALGRVMADAHAQLVYAGVTVSVVVVTARDDNGDLEPAIVVRGQPRAAKISITNEADRARGVADVRLLIDSMSLGTSSSLLSALLDHELEHLTPVTDKQGAPKVDSCGRPRLRIRHHDWEVGGFDSVAQRHGEASAEVRMLTRLHDEHGQYLMFPRPMMSKKAGQKMTG